MTDAKAMVAKASNLISLPGVALEVDRLLKDPRSTIKDVARVIESDTALTARLLKVGNSVLVRNVNPINTVDRAISRIGSRMVTELVMSIEVARSFDGIDNELISVEDFWRHSIYTALVAQSIARQCKNVDPGEAFTAGLLHDIGQLVMFNTISEQVEECVARSRDPLDDLPSYAVEHEIFGFDHTNVGLELAAQWQLPLSLQEAIYGHHQPEKIGRPSNLTMVVHMANSLAVLCEADSPNIDDTPHISEQAWTQLELSSSQIAEFVLIGKDQANGLLAAFVTK